jgi:phosphoglycerate dehydrogenase-like enzyme
MKICLSEEMADRITNDIAALEPVSEIVCLHPDGTYTGEPEGIEVFCFSVDLSTSKNSLDEALRLLSVPTLDWVQAPGAGIELPIWAEVLERGVRLTTAAGVHAEPVAQYVFTQILHWHRQVAAHQDLQSQRRWEPLLSDDLATKTVGIVGFGGIGRAVARVAKAFGMSVVALSRTRTTDPNVDRYRPPGELVGLMTESDYIVLCVPLTDETHGLVGSGEIAAMGSNAVLINVARGGVLDQDALLHGLESGTIAGASLDVTDPEPLPSDSKLWSLPNCVITAHDAGPSPLAGARLGKLFVQNVELFLSGRRMQNEVP